MAETLIEVSRGQIIECIHRGDIAIVDTQGNVLHSVGNPEKICYMRSSAKPIQALNVLLSGAYEQYHLTEKELAVICSSHYAEPDHLQAVQSILQKIGLDDQAVQGGIVPSLNPHYALQLAREQVELTPLFSDCSGKHAGMLAVCQKKGYSTDDYLNPDHPCQKEILTYIASLCCVRADDITIGIDGCSAPVHALPLKNIAWGFARFTHSSDLSPEYQKATDKIFQVMNHHPEMISGKGGFCTDLITHCRGKLIGKIGAEGVYCVGLKDRNVGVAVKIESGNTAVLPPVVMHILNSLNVLEPSEQRALEKWYRMNNTNDIGTIVGEIRPVFSL